MMRQGDYLGVATCSRRTSQQSCGSNVDGPVTYYYSLGPPTGESEEEQRTRGPYRRFDSDDWFLESTGGPYQIFDSDDWFLEMLEKDQDDCTKKLICEMAAKKARGPLYGIETDLSEAFGLDNFIDVSSPKAVFDMAAQTGKLMGEGRCDAFYKRCKTPVDDILEMIKTEMEDFIKLEKEDMEERNSKPAIKKYSQKERQDLGEQLGLSRELVWK